MSASWLGSQHLIWVEDVDANVYQRFVWVRVTAACKTFFGVVEVEPLHHMLAFFLSVCFRSKAKCSRFPHGRKMDCGDGVSLCGVLALVACPLFGNEVGLNGGQRHKHRHTPRALPVPSGP